MSTWRTNHQNDNRTVHSEMTRCSVIFIVLFCLFAFSSASKDSQLLMNMYGECLAICEEITESQEACSEICDFVNHLYNHDPTVFRKYRILLEVDPDVTEFSIKDTIYRVVQTKTEDKHELALYFRDALVRWGDYKTLHPEVMSDRNSSQKLN